MHAFIEKQETINTQLAQTMTDFKDTLAKFTSALSFQEKGKFSSQPQQNPKGQYNSNASSSGSQHMDQVEDEKGTENIVADHLSKLTIDSTSDITPIEKYFPGQSLLSRSPMPWFANHINFLATGDLPAH